MKTMKLGVILLALLLVGMAMVPMVNAAEQNANSVSAVDLSKIQLPQLQFNNSQQKVIVTRELSPSESTQSAQVTAMVAASKTPSVSTIPYGSIIYHSKNGITTVFDSQGKQLFSAEDATAAKVTTPRFESPATFVHEIPSGSLSKEYQGKTFVFFNGKLILTIIDDTPESSTNPDSQTPGSTSSSLISPTAVSKAATTATTPNWRDWIEYAESTPVTIDRFESTWNAPTRTPLNSGVRESVAIWNGIERSGVEGVMQPVLMWNFCAFGDSQIHNNYVGAAWEYRSITNPNKDSLHSTPISVSPGDKVLGTLQWSSSNNCWIIQFKNVATGRTTAFYTTRFPKDNLKLYMALEATAAGIKPTTNSLPGSITFNNIIVQNGGSNVPVTFTGHIWPGASSVFTGLNSRVTTYPQLQVNLDTGR